MKAALKQTHTERNEFRRELEQAHVEMEKLRAEQPAAPDTGELLGGTRQCARPPDGGKTVRPPLASVPDPWADIFHPRAKA